jgi:FkbM family methyltransferase
MGSQMRISRILYKPLAYLFYAHVKRQRVPYEREINLRALGININSKPKIPIKLSLNPSDRGFSKEFSLYGFREILNSLFVYYIIRKYRPCVIDIGANLGYYVALEAIAGAEKIIAIEPIPLTYFYLRRNSEIYENVMALNVALANRDGEVNMTFSDSFNLAHITESRHFSHTESHIRVKGVSLNTLITNLGLQNFKNIMLRMDIEGYEHRILGENIPEQISLINVELHPSNYDVKIFCQKIVNQGFLIEYFIGDIPFGFYPLINTFGPKIIKILKPWYTVAEKVHLEDLDRLMQNAIHPYIFFNRKK